MLKFKFNDQRITKNFDLIFHIIYLLVYSLTNQREADNVLAPRAVETRIRAL